MNQETGTRRWLSTNHKTTLIDIVESAVTLFTKMTSFVPDVVQKLESKI
jgi:hypothetical protein